MSSLLDTKAMRVISVEELKQHAASFEAILPEFRSLQVEPDGLELRVWGEFSINSYAEPVRYQKRYREFWRLTGLFFDGLFLAVLQQAGVHGHDHVARYIFDSLQFDMMLWKLSKHNPGHYNTKHTPYTVIRNDRRSLDELSTFFGYSLDQAQRVF